MVVLYKDWFFIGMLRFFAYNVFANGLLRGLVANSANKNRIENSRRFS
jgi:hypothetical protein